MFIETYELHDTNCCDSIVTWSIEEMSDFGKNSFNPPWGYHVLFRETSGKVCILTRITNPNTLQDLCRNVILASTLGIPNSIDCLPLPIGMKEYCKQLIS